MKIKVCQVCAVDFTLNHFLLPLIDGMRDQGWDVMSVCSDGPTIQTLRARGYRIETIPISRSLNPLKHPKSIAAMVRFFRQERFDVVHVHTPVAALLGRIAAKIAGIPCVIYTAHGFYFHDEMPAWKRSIFVLLERLGGRWTDVLFTQSEEDAKAAVDRGIMPPDSVLAIGNGVDMHRFNPAQVGDGAEQREALGIPGDAIVVGMIGRLVREKGVMEFLTAATILADRFPNAWFVLVGERLPSDHAVGVDADIAAAQLVLRKRLVLTGPRSDIPQLLAAMDVFCLPSWREGMPRTIIEAMMMGKPVVATDIRGSREEIVADTTGLLVPTRRPEQLAAAIARCIANPVLARKLGAAGRERAIQLYDEKKIVSLQIGRIAACTRRTNLMMR